MILFPSGIAITTTEQLCLLHVVTNVEQWLTDSIAETARLRRNALIEEWRPRLHADPDVAELPANSQALVELIMARDDYKTRLQRDAEQEPPVPLYKHATAKFNGTHRAGMAVRRPDRVPGDATVMLFAGGLTVVDIDVNCILAYAQDVEDGIIGVLMGQVNRGKKKMIAQYHPVILADPSVTTMPATEEGLINMIVARDDYKAMHR